MAWHSRTPGKAKWLLTTCIPPSVVALASLVAFLNLNEFVGQLTALPLTSWHLAYLAGVAIDRPR